MYVNIDDSKIVNITFYRSSIHLFFYCTCNNEAAYGLKVQMNEIAQIHFSISGTYCIHLIQKSLSSELLHCVLRIVAYPERKAPWMVPTMRQRHSCISHGSNVEQNALRSWHATMYKFVTSMVLCGLGMQQCAMHNAQCNNSEDNLF